MARPLGNFIPIVTACNSLRRSWKRNICPRSNIVCTAPGRRRGRRRCRFLAGPAPSEPETNGKPRATLALCPLLLKARPTGSEMLYPVRRGTSVLTSVDGFVTLEAEWGNPMMTISCGRRSVHSARIIIPTRSRSISKCRQSWAVRDRPHPRYFTDASNSTPLAVPALIRSEWWPMMFFCIFKAPPPGVVHVFRKDETVHQLQRPALDARSCHPRHTNEPKRRQRSEIRSRRLAKSRDEPCGWNQMAILDEHHIRTRHIEIWRGRQ